MRLVIVALLLPLTLTAAAATADPQDARAERDAALIFDRVMSPYCPGRTLATCGSSAAETLRLEIKRDLRSGLPAADVENALYRRFGNSIRGVPEARGVGLIAWVAPPVLLLAGAVWLVTWLRGHSRSTADEASVAPEEPSHELLDRLDDELAEM